MSVIVRTRNRPSKLALALRSLANQTDARFEVIVVNDGGEDVQELVERQLDRVPHLLVTNAEAVGRSSALNVGVSEARTDLIGYLDDDDIVLPFHVATLLDGWERTGRDASIINYSHYSLAFMGLVPGGRPRVEGRQRLPLWAYSREALLSANRPAIHTWLHPREVWEALGGFNPELTMFEDWDFLLRATATHSLRGIQQETCEYRFYLDSANLTLDRARAFDELERLYGRFPVSDRKIDAERRTHLRDLQHQVSVLNEVDTAFARGELTSQQHARLRVAAIFSVELER